MTKQYKNHWTYDSTWRKMPEQIICHLPLCTIPILHVGNTVPVFHTHHTKPIGNKMPISKRQKRRVHTGKATTHRTFGKIIRNNFMTTKIIDQKSRICNSPKQQVIVPTWKAGDVHRVICTPKLVIEFNLRTGNVLMN